MEALKAWGYCTDCIHKYLVLDITCYCSIPKPVETLCVIFRGKLCSCSFVQHVYFCVSIRSESARRRRRGSVLRTYSGATTCSTSCRTAASRSRGGQKRDLYMTELLDDGVLSFLSGGTMMSCSRTVQRENKEIRYLRPIWLSSRYWNY